MAPSSSASSLRRRVPPDPKTRRGTPHTWRVIPNDIVTGVLESINSSMNGDVVTAVFTNANGTTTAVGEVYNLP